VLRQSSLQTGSSVITRGNDLKLEKTFKLVKYYCINCVVNLRRDKMYIVSVHWRVKYSTILTTVLMNDAYPSP